MPYNSENIFKDVKDNYGSIITAEINNEQLINSENILLSITELIYFGPIFIEFQESVLGKVDKFNYFTFDLSMTDDYVPHPVILTPVGSFNMSDEFNPSSDGFYRLDEMRPNNLLAFNFVSTYRDNIEKNQPVSLEKQLKIDINKISNPTFNGSVKIYIHQWIQDITGL